MSICCSVLGAEGKEKRSIRMFNFILSVFHVVVLPHEKRFAGFRVQFICSIDDLV